MAVPHYIDAVCAHQNLCAYTDHALNKKNNLLKISLKTITQYNKEAL